ncbi:hypothetical protein [Gluconobacter oxydans]|uniref:hypothetical protein n=1 Tax=Gluconobacter oxydans TaxID=442 RepID=UPI001CD8FEE7|nr:hypothetical protein [Gluconobacter oxydans]
MNSLFLNWRNTDRTFIRQYCPANDRIHARRTMPDAPDRQCTLDHPSPVERYHRSSDISSNLLPPPHSPP